MPEAESAIKVEAISKSYEIGMIQRPHGTLAEAVTRWTAAAIRRIRLGPTARTTVWALRDVSFKISQGEVVGIIGRNGAGKSTLLKIISRITDPTSGRAEVRGRVASLLEVGTGFHGELSGRENVYLNGAILGMKRREIDEKFDQIVEFAEVAKFIDTPVKHYSSGMYLRLAFAVAAHLEPDILLVDEVLAVGDAEFQKKCLRHMDRATDSGRTVVFVSHQLSAVRSLCTRVIQLDGGRLQRDGDPREVVRQYLSDGSQELKAERRWQPETRPGDTQLRLSAVRLRDGASELCNTFYSSQPIIVEMEFELLHEHSALLVGFDLTDREGTVILRSFHTDRDQSTWPRLQLGMNCFRGTIPPGLLNQGEYFVSPKIGLHRMQWIVNGDAEVGFGLQVDHSPSPFWADRSLRVPGVIAPCLEWQSI